jgi:ectoine hydroxylase-related dioxygenase (phytanoyl-CoA dioxygenase family)
MEELKTIIAELFKFTPIEGTGLKQEDAYLSILRSIIKDGGPPDSYQQAHRDYLTEMVDQCDKKPLTCLIAFEDFTKFCYFRNSHAKGMEDLYKEEKPTELILMKGEFVAFHPKLVHFGGAYTESNLRMHVYLMSPECGVGTVQDEDGNVQLATECRSLRGGKSSEKRKSEQISKSRSAKEFKKLKREQQTKRLSTPKVNKHEK